MEKGPTGKLVGTDYHGNKYFEDESATYSAFWLGLGRDLEGWPRGAAPRLQPLQRGASPLLCCIGCARLLRRH
jgi:hypothetical protein